MRQNYDKNFLQNILDQYNNLGVINSHFLFTSGYENSNYFIETNKGRLVIKIFEGIGVKAENVLYELEVMDFSFRAGVKTPRLLKNKEGRLVTAANKKFACLMEFIEGDNMARQILSDKLIAEVGREAGKMDLALKHFKNEGKTRPDYEFDLKSTPILEKSLALLPKKFDQKIFKEIFKEFKFFYSRFISLPAGLIHNDIVPHNWLVKDGKLNGIIDFSDMEFSPYIQNIAVSLHLGCFSYNYNPDQAKIFIDHYRRFNSLSENEIGLLYILIKVRFVAFVVEFHNWNIEYGLDEQRVEAVNDHYKFLERFIAIGHDEFNKIIGQ